MLQLLAPLIEQVGLADATLVHRGGLAAEGVVTEGETLAETVGVEEGLAVGVVLEFHRIAGGAGERLHGVVEIGAIGGGVVIVRG